MKTILVTGDPICDHDYYRGNRSTADSMNERGFRTIRKGGGALLLEKLINKTTQPLCEWTTVFGLEVTYEELPKDYHAFCLWEPQWSNPNEKNEGKRFQVWRAVEPPLGYGQREPGSSANDATFKALGTAKVLPSVPDILVIDDAGLEFRNARSKERWPFASFPKGGCPRWIVLKLSGSIGEGHLWGTIQSHCKDNLVIIVSADQLRRGDVRLSKGMSWEATVETLLTELESNPALAALKIARHLIVTFRSDGAFWLNNSHDPSRSSILVFDAANAEGDWEITQGAGSAFGYMSCFTAAIVHQLCVHQLEIDRAPKPEEVPTVPDLETAIGAALGAGRELKRLGHGRVNVTRKNDGGSESSVATVDPGFPFEEIADKIHKPTEKFVSAKLPAQLSQHGVWMMLDEWQVHAHTAKRQRPHHEAALATAILGPAALERFPVARFGSLLTVDRQEIESLRSLRAVMVRYQNGGPQTKPLNIGVFGPPGAGKSFGVKQIAKTVLGDKVDILPFNLSQFSNPTDLNGAFHLIRDKVLTGVSPLVFWDEFDSQGYRWLQYLLAPMQDGVFQDGQLSHPIGKCLFVFAGATSPTFGAFGPRNPKDIEKDELSLCGFEQSSEIDERWRDFVLKKGPDFKSRLAGYLDVLGPNPAQQCFIEKGRRDWKDDSQDLCYPVRRAFFIRSQFKLKDGQRLHIDSGLLRALLEIPHYKAGARSLEFLCQHLLQGGSIPRRSSLPGEHLLNMHVNASEFWDICERDLPFLAEAPKLASCLHEAYRLRISARPEKAHLDVEFTQLDPDMQAANLAQALRISDNLRLLNLCLVKSAVVDLKDIPSSRRPEEEALRKILTEPENLELLAEAEHNGWMVERILRGWRYGRMRDDKKKTHPLLIPYSQLSEMDKNYDRHTISGKVPEDGDPRKEEFGYIDIVKTAGFRVSYLEQRSKAVAVR